LYLWLQLEGIFPNQKIERLPEQIY